ncbi:hypothetical protein ACJMK2_009261 [Sinanodonta woodiana]|uniref:Uncharacterized protein n=1 Tax=Sinanodonta woodiana TaxID=1069815 RepID=A0ABD3VD92_SINWO
MPAGDRGFSVNTPQSTAVLMDIVSKLKQELQQARVENGKLIDQLNCLLSLVKRSWTGDDAATHHLANIVGVPPPNFEGLHSNTPIPETKSQAAKHWERLVVKLLEREYAQVQAEIRDHQQRYIQNRQLYMHEVLLNHQDEMAKFSLNRRKGSRFMEDVDKRFMRCYTAKTRQRSKSESRVLQRPKSAYQKVPRTASDMVEHVDLTVEALLQPHPSPAGSQININSTANNLYKMTQETEQRREPRIPFDDPRRYKQNNLFDAEVIFGPEGQETESKSRSATAGMPSTIKDGRPRSAVFLTEKPVRPLKYETTRPVSLKPKSAGPRGRVNSGQHRKEHSASSRKGLERQNSKQDDGAQQEGDQEIQQQQHEENGETEFSEAVQSPEDEEEQDEEVTRTKPPMMVHVRRPEAVNKFAADLKKMSEMEENFRKTAIELQKKIGISEGGMVF